MAEKKRILVVDDEKDMIEYISTLLADNGYEVKTANNGNEAMKALQGFRPDLITLDVVMPDKSGVKFYRETREDDKLATIPIIFITGVSPDFEKFISTRKAAPAPEGYISKPFEPDQLLSKIEKLIGETKNVQTA